MTARQPTHADVLAVMHAADAVAAGRWIMRCPAHGGSSASSLEVTLSDGRYILHCAFGCTPEQIVQAALDRLRAKCDSCDEAEIKFIRARDEHASKAR